MMVSMATTVGSNILSVKLSGKLTRADYERFLPEVEREIQKHEKIRVLVQMRDFEGWDAGALWEDTKFAARHYSHIERLALVGDKKWEQGMAAFCKPFTAAEVRFFEPHELDEAKEWVSGPENFADGSA